MPLSLVTSMVEPFSLQLYLDFSQKQIGHLLSEVPMIANFHLWDRYRVTKGVMIGNREERKRFQAYVPACLPLSIPKANFLAPPAFCQGHGLGT